MNGLTPPERSDPFTAAYDDSLLDEAAMERQAEMSAEDNAREDAYDDGTERAAACTCHRGPIGARDCPVPGHPDPSLVTNHPSDPEAQDRVAASKPRLRVKCWSCGKTLKWKKPPTAPRPLCHKCAYGGYFGGS